MMNIKTFLFYFQNKTQGTSINVFKNKHQKPKTGKYIPFDIKRSEILNVVQEHRTVLRSISFPKETSKCSPLMEDSQQMASTEPHFPNLKEKYQSVDLFKRGKLLMEVRKSETNAGTVYFL